MTEKTLDTQTTRRHRRLLLPRRAGSRTVARISLVVSSTGASLLVATASSPAAAHAEHGSDPHHNARPHTIPLVEALRRFVQSHRPTAPISTTTTSIPTPVTTPPAPAAPAPSPTPREAASVSPAARTATPPRPAPAPAPAPPRPAPVAVATHGILPPNHPSANLPAGYQSVCLSSGFGSLSCVAGSLQAIDAGRAAEGLAPMNLPSTYAALSPDEQLFVLANLDRVARGLPPVLGLVSEFDQDAVVAAQGNADPTPTVVPVGTRVLSWASNWDENTGPLGSDFGWMYDDGPGSGNVACNAGNATGCWGHRDNILSYNAQQLTSSGGFLVMGASEAVVAADSPWVSDAELFVVLSTSPEYYLYTWAQAVAAGAG